MNEKFFAKYQGQGLRYEIAAFVSKINGRDGKKGIMTEKDSIVLASLMEKYISGTDKVYI